MRKHLEGFALERNPKQDGEEKTREQLRRGAGNSSRDGEFENARGGTLPIQGTNPWEKGGLSQRRLAFKGRGTGNPSWSRKVNHPDAEADPIPGKLAGGENE